MDIREYFKELVSQAKADIPYEAERPLIQYGSQRKSWFVGKGKYAYLTDSYIDECKIEDLKEKLVLFIKDCFKQR